MYVYVEMLIYVQVHHSLKGTPYVVLLKIGGLTPSLKGKGESPSLEEDYIRSTLERMMDLHICRRFHMYMNTKATKA